MGIWVTSGFHTRAPKGQMVPMSQFSLFLLSTCGTLLEPTHPPLPLVQPPLLKPPLHQQLPQTRGQNEPIQRIKMRRLKRETLSALQ